jgi:DNA-directed RNA polymerase specialized sigma24 family protein
LNAEISSAERPISLRSNTQLSPLDKAEIAARAWCGQSSDDLAEMFGVARRTINRVIRESQQQTSA